jgi:membrane protein
LTACASKGAALAFYALFSMTPILVLAIAVAGYFFGAEAAQGEIIAQLPKTVGPNGARAIQALLAAARDPVSGRLATIVAGLLLLIATTSVFAELKESLDEIWGVPLPQHQVFLSLLRTRFLAFGLVLVLCFLLLVSLSQLLPSCPFWRDMEQLRLVLSVLSSCFLRNHLSFSR